MFWTDRRERRLGRKRSFCFARDEIVDLILIVIKDWFPFVVSASFENRSDGTVTVDRVETRTGNIANTGTMTVTGDLVSASDVNHQGKTLSVGDSIQANGQIFVGEAELKMTSEDAQLGATSVYNKGTILGQSQITIEKGILTNKGRVSGFDGARLELLAAGEVVNDVNATISVKDMTSDGMVTNLGMVSASGAVKVEALENGVGPTLTAGSLTTTRANHAGHLSNEGKMTVAGHVEVRGHFGNLREGEFKAGTLTTSSCLRWINWSCWYRPNRKRGLGSLTS